MMLHTSQIQPPPIFRRRRGFSFAEVMFAVIILGIGFIMVAAIFPVAIQQTKLTVDETAAAAVARSAASNIEQLAIGSDSIFPVGAAFPPTKLPGSPTPPLVLSPRTAGWGQPAGAPGTVPPELWSLLRGNLISASDPRYAWTMLYSRDISDTGTPASNMRVYIFVLLNRNRTLYEPTDISLPTAPSAPVNLQPRRLQAIIHGPDPANPADPAHVQFVGTGAAFVVGQNFEGAFLVIANAAPTSEIGKVLRLGIKRSDDRYEVDPAYDVPAASLANAEAWFVGPGIEFNPTNPAVPAVSGESMDVALFTTFVRVN